MLTVVRDNAVTSFGLAATLVGLFGLAACSTAQLDAADARLKAAQTVAVAACTARATAPQIATALRKGLEDSVPGGAIAQGVVSGSCELLGVKQP